MISGNTELVMWFGVKLMVLLGIIIYGVFAGVIVRQEYLMTKTMEAKSETTLTFLTWLHLGIAIVLFILALLLL